jgi:hypothetical protein
MASNKVDFYRSEVGYPSPTSSQIMASKNAEYLPKMGKNPLITGQNQLKNPKP